LEQVKVALRRCGVDGITVTNVHGIASEKGTTVRYRGAERTIEGVSKLKLETIVRDEITSTVVDALYESAHTGDVGDGIISVTDLALTVRIRTGETVSVEEAYA
jgi:nitrogen regulatory protein PII